MAEPDKHSIQLPQLAPTLFFRALPEAYSTHAPVANGHQLIENALILISMGRFNSAFVTLVSAVESLLTRDDSDEENRDIRSLRVKLSEFERSKPGAITRFLVLQNGKYVPNDRMEACIDLRNTVTHSGYSTAYDDASAAQMLTVAWPLLEAVYGRLFGSELSINLIVEVSEQLENARRIWVDKTGFIKGASSAYKPLSWAIRRYISPNYAPGFLWDINGEQIDWSEHVFNATEAMRSLEGFDDETLSCPICGEHSVAVKFDFDRSTKSYGLHISAGACGNCSLRLMSTPQDRLIGDVLFGSYFAENEDRLAAEYGLGDD